MKPDILSANCWMRPNGLEPCNATTSVLFISAAERSVAHYIVVCAKCGTRGQPALDPQTAVSYWNTAAAFDQKQREDRERERAQERIEASAQEWRDPIVSIHWNAEDVRTLRPDWTYEQCVHGLDSVSKALHDLSISHGWQILESNLPDLLAPSINEPAYDNTDKTAEEAPRFTGLVPKTNDALLERGNDPPIQA